MNNKIKLIVICALFFMCSCAKSSVNDIRMEGKYHYTYYSDTNLENLYNFTMKKYNECGIPISNNFIDTTAGEAAASYTLSGHGWFSHADFKSIAPQKTQIDVYSILDIGIPGNFIKITRSSAELKKGCPDDLYKY